VVPQLLRHANMKVTADVYVQAVSPQKGEAQSKLVRIVLRKMASQGSSSVPYNAPAALPSARPSV
jgi:hypothetical protein